MNWPHFAAGTAAGIIDELDADRSGLPGDTMCVNYHTTTNNSLSLVYSYNRGATWTSSGQNYLDCSEPVITWVKDNQWAAAHKYIPSKRNSVFKSNNSGQDWNWVYFDTTAQDTLNEHLSISACHGTGQILVATDWNTGDTMWDKEIMVYCATDGYNTEFAYSFITQFSGDQGLPVVNCLRFGGNDWGNLAYCDYGYSGDSIRYAYNYQGCAFNFPEIVSDRPGAGAAAPIQPRIAYCDDGGHPGPAIFYAGAGRQGIYMNAGWVTGVAGKPETMLPKSELRLEQCRPNPFKQTTTITYQIPKPGMVNLSVYNVAGQLVRTLVDGWRPAGAHAVKWDGRDGTGREISTGVYFYRLTAGAGTATRKMTAVK
jgi:hypothetical protein